MKKAMVLCDDPTGKLLLQNEDDVEWPRKIQQGGSGRDINCWNRHDTATLISQLAEHGLAATEIDFGTGPFGSYRLGSEIRYHGPYPLAHVLNNDINNISPELTLLPGFEWALGGNI
jgi:hypothetical protein